MNKELYVSSTPHETRVGVDGRRSARRSIFRARERIHPCGFHLQRPRDARASRHAVGFRRYRPGARCLPVCFRLSGNRARKTRRVRRHPCRTGNGRSQAARNSRQPHPRLPKSRKTSRRRSRMSPKISPLRTGMAKRKQRASLTPPLAMRVIPKAPVAGVDAAAVVADVAGATRSSHRAPRHQPNRRRPHGLRRRVRNHVRNRDRNRARNHDGNHARTLGRRRDTRPSFCRANRFRSIAVAPRSPSHTQ